MLAPGSPPEVAVARPEVAGPTAARHERRTWLVAALALGVALLLGVGSRLAGSAAVAGEALHMLAHGAAFLMAGAAYVIARRLAAAGRPRAAALAPDAAAVLNGVILLLLGADLAARSLAALHGGGAAASGPALALAGVGLVVNLAAVLLLRHSHAHEHGHGRDVNFLAVYLHVVGDAAVGVLAIAALLAQRTLGWLWADPAAGLVGAALVMALGLQVLARSAPLMWRAVAPRAG